MQAAAPRQCMTAQARIMRTKSDIASIVSSRKAIHYLGGKLNRLLY